MPENADLMSALREALTVLQTSIIRYVPAEGRYRDDKDAYNRAMAAYDTVSEATMPLRTAPSLEGARHPETTSVDGHDFEETWRGDVRVDVRCRCGKTPMDVLSERRILEGARHPEAGETDAEPLERCCNLADCKCRYARSQRGAGHDHARAGCAAASPGARHDDVPGVDVERRCNCVGVGPDGLFGSADGKRAPMHLAGCPAARLGSKP